MLRLKHSANKLTLVALLCLLVVALFIDAFFIDAEQLWMHGGSPSVSSCGLGSPTIKGNDLAGYITTGTGTVLGCTLTFSTTKTDPACVLTSSGPLAIVSQSSISPTGIVIALSVSLAAGRISYVCWDNL